jgi:hypothetical protein
MKLDHDDGGNLVFPDAEDRLSLAIATHSYILEKFSGCKTTTLLYLSHRA